jgi:hypothetical protein
LVRFRYRVLKGGHLRVAFANRNGATGEQHVASPAPDQWSEATLAFPPGSINPVEEIHFVADKENEFLIDDVLLYEP